MSILERESVSPSSGEVVAAFPIMGAEGVRLAVDTGRIAARWWGDLGWDGRRARLMAWKGAFARRADELAHLVHRETGKPVDDARLEIILAIDHLNWAARNAERVLMPRRVRSGILTLNQEATLCYEPMGVVGVIGPWNYPVFTPIGSIAYALAAGNAVVFKPSEWSTAVGSWLVESFGEAVSGLPVLQLITGDGTTGAALCDSGVDVVSFTGSTAVGKKVMAACAATLTPVVLECGGKDALLVDAHADVEAAADAIAFGAFSNAGQTCVGVERVYAHTDVYDELLASLSRRAQALLPGHDEDASYGPMTMPSQVDVVSRHVRDAVARGGRLIEGGVPDGSRVINPVVLADVPEDSDAVVKETFGPLVVVNRVHSLDEGVDRANASRYGLAASIFSRDRSRAMAAARRLQSGMVSINSWVMYAGVPGLPWGGVKESGVGRIHGADGLRSFCQPKSIVRQRFALPIALTSFERNPRATKAMLGVFRLLHGRGR
ncbi:MAG: aldehyde dehydrogenase family protein [Actinobacteria bacterium]|nr:aldehyde dehydrogenase family protein [Actinomycetota bacterium]